MKSKTKAHKGLLCNIGKDKFRGKRAHLQEYLLQLIKKHCTTVKASTCYHNNLWEKIKTTLFLVRMMLFSTSNLWGMEGFDQKKLWGMEYFDQKNLWGMEDFD